MYYALFESNGTIEGINNMLILRGIFAPGGHVVWAALYGGALAAARNRGPLKPVHFCSPLFLGCFAAAFAMHFAWNYNGYYLLVLRIGNMEFSLKHILLILIAWLILLRLIKLGVLQCMLIPQVAAAPPSVPAHAAISAPAPAPAAPKLKAVTGIYAGNAFPLTGGRLIIGRDGARANIVYPQGAPGISSVHCELSCRQGAYYLTDKNSTHGTFLADGTKLPPEKDCLLPRGGAFVLASKENMFEVE
jgi:hypothetical protein